ncbi:unnamed protein product [Lactuca virosa]|uniref:Uncharacterized protein n=1 Tax=Lactuca virosa TaxID=75947 RepID=A0AAU9LVM1_9ASTR|nr:unnamed protein product [Lactuca virosa]
MPPSNQFSSGLSLHTQAAHHHLSPPKILKEGETIRITVKNKPASGAGMLSSAGLSEKIKPLNLAPPPEKVKSKPLGLAPPPVASGKIRSPIPPAPNDPAAVRMTSTTHHIAARNSTNAFTYFSQLEGSDQDKLKQMVSEEDRNSTKREGDVDAESDKRDLKKLKMRKVSKRKRMQQMKRLLQTESIEGFSQLKSNDQEKLKKLMTERDQSSKKTSDKIDEDIGLKIDFSANDVKDNYKVRSINNFCSILY